MLSWMSGIINPNPWRLCVHVRCIVVRKREQARASARACVCGGAIPRSLCVFLFLPSRHSFFLCRARHSHGEGTCLLFRDRQEGQRFVVFSSVPWYLCRLLVCCCSFYSLLFPFRSNFFSICLCTILVYLCVPVRLWFVFASPLHPGWYCSIPESLDGVRRSELCGDLFCEEA